MHLLQQFFVVRDENLEGELSDRDSFEEFIGLGVMNSRPAVIKLS